MSSSDDSPGHENSTADVWGLPARTASQGRDRLEEVASEYLRKVRAGEKIDLEDFVSKYGSLKDPLREFLPLVAAMEGWKSHRELKSIQQPLPESFEFERLGDFRIIGEIARGGMGVVFEAEQDALGRRVALKLLPWRFPRNSSWAEQFQREARIAAQLQHAHIVPVYSFGEQDNRHFYAMQLIQGVGLDKLILKWNQEGFVALDDLLREFRPSLALPPDDQKRSKRLLRKDSWQQLAKIAAQIVSAIRYAHKQKTLHRDIKPANLLIDLNGEVWITDFGLAIGREKLLDDASEPLAGTLRYMAPEQFRGGGDERSDLYSFGATLYELCTLRPAFDGKTQRDLLRDISKGKFPSPRSVNPAIPGALERIILKAMSSKSEERYQSADPLHADLLTFLNEREKKEQGGVWKRIRGWF